MTIKKPNSSIVEKLSSPLIFMVVSRCRPYTQIRIEEIHFTQIRRILKIEPSVENLNLDNNDGNNPITVIVDASGLTITKKGDYIEQKWIRKKKEFVKLHNAVDAKSEKIISFRVIKGNVHDSKKFSPMIREVSGTFSTDKARLSFHR